MYKRIAILPAVALVAVACGSDDGGGLTDDQQAAVDQVMEEDGADEVFDRDCVEEKAAKLSEDDAALIAESGEDGDLELSEEGRAITIELTECFDRDALVDEFVSGMEESGTDFDEQCVRDELEDFDMSELAIAGQEGEIPEGLISSLFDCFDFDAEG